MADKLWTDKDVREAFKTYGRNNAKKMRDDYERALAFRNEDIGRLQGELRAMQARIAELEAAINGCAGQWTPIPEGAHYCGCSEEDCPGDWRIENNGSRLVIGDGESELSVEFYEAIRVCWQVQPSINAES